MDSPTSPTRSQESEATVRFFDTVADQYSGIYASQTPGGVAFQVRRRRVLDFFDQDGGSVLDVGCGPGVMVENLLARGCTFTGVDPSERMIEEARRIHRDKQNVNFFVGRAESIAQPDATFDAVLCMGVVERVPDDEIALREMIRVLKPGGTLIVTLPNRLSPYMIWRDFVFYKAVASVRPLYYRLKGQTPPAVIPGHRLYSATSYGELVQRNQARVEEVGYCGFNVVPSPLDVWLPGLAASTLAKLEPVGRTPLRRLGACIIVKARKR